MSEIGTLIGYKLITYNNIISVIHNYPSRPRFVHLEYYNEMRGCEYAKNNRTTEALMTNKTQ